ncbi:MAG: glyoxylate/hydroxypyruvate reductase A [Alphaproteobacteria bacterium]|nr:glyoxylate/hydroxypyruvate reductase A [Alphaproteobacteria bacterium]
MAIILISRFHPEDWVRAIEQRLPGQRVLVYPDIGDPAEVEIALVHRPMPGVFKQFPNLKAIIGLFAGIDSMVSDPDLPDVPFARMVDPLLTRDVAHYVVFHSLRYYRDQPRIEANQRAGRWENFGPPTLAFTVGIMGLGEIGRLAARMLADLGFAVRGWSRTPRTVDRVETFHGPTGLDRFLAGTNVLAMVLPLTAETTGIVRQETLALLPKGACVINAGRGAHVVDADLLAAIDSGHIAGATLDVFNPEPPPPQSRFWSHPKVTITPHNAGDPRPESIAGVAVENIRRARTGLPLLHLVDRKRGY